MQSQKTDESVTYKNDVTGKSVMEMDGKVKLNDGNGKCKVQMPLEYRQKKPHTGPFR